MAKTSKIIKTRSARRTVERYAKKRAELKAIIKNHESSPQEIQDAYRKLRSLPRDASPTRIRNRCALTGRPRGYIRKFGLSRIAMRELALQGELPGVVKSSW